MTAITNRTRSTTGSMPIRWPSPAITPATRPRRVSRRSARGGAAVLISSIVTRAGVPGEPAEHQDQADGARQRHGDPAEGDVDDLRGIEEHQHAEDGDRRPRRERDHVDPHPVAHARASAARWGAAPAW